MAPHTFLCKHISHFSELCLTDLRKGDGHRTLSWIIPDCDTLWISDSAQCCHTMIIPLRVPPRPPTLPITDWHPEKGLWRALKCIQNLPQIKIVEPWTCCWPLNTFRQSFMTLVSLTNCQLECCPLPQCLHLCATRWCHLSRARTYHLC